MFPIIDLCNIFRLENKSLFVAIDETTDQTGRAMCIVLAGPLDGQFLDRPYLIDVVDAMAANNKTIQQIVISALFNLFGNNLDYGEVRLFLTDGAAYCVKAGVGLKSIFPNLIHTTCLAHGLHRVAELARSCHPKVDKLISDVKKIFVKSARRRALFKASCEAPLPPEPIITR